MPTTVPTAVPTATPTATPTPTPTAAPTGVAATIALAVSPQSLGNPVAPGALGALQNLTVTVTVKDAGGNVISPDSLATPVQLTVYAPPGVVSPQSTVVSAPNGVVPLSYLGGFYENPMMVTAVSGTASASAELLQNNAVCAIPASDASIPLTLSTPTNNLASGWHMKISVGGGVTRTVGIDTGSRGLIISRTAIGANAIGPGAAGTLEYTSDGKIYQGHYFLAPLTLDVGGANATTIPVEVLGVESTSCDPNYPSCTPTNVSSVGNMGIGYGRYEAIGGPEVNPLIHVTQMVQGGMHAGFTISQSGIALGVASNDTLGFSYASLQHTQPVAGKTFYPGDWAPSQGCFGLPTYGTTYCGTLLMDTGIGSMILGLAPSQRPAPIATANPLPTGLAITIAAPSTAAPIMSYGFTLGDTTNPYTPTASSNDPAARWSSGGVAVNIGRHVIAGYDFQFDDACGRIGYRALTP